MKIPIKFEYEGKPYQGVFSMVTGSGATGLYHLMIGDFYYGQLFHSEHFGWQWGSNKGFFKGQAEYFGSYVSEYLASQKEKPEGSLRLQPSGLKRFLM